MVTYRGITAIRQDSDALQKWLPQVSTAAAAFEARWTILSLGRVDPSLADRLREQRDLFNAAVVTGTAEQVEVHGAAMCRGYAAACGALEQAGAPDDAYVLGSDPATGVRVAIGVQRAAAARVREVHGEGVIWLTPDEVAAMMAASGDAAHFVGTVKRLFPGAVVT